MTSALLSIRAKAARPAPLFLFIIASLLVIGPAHNTVMADGGDPGEAIVPNSGHLRRVDTVAVSPGGEYILSSAYGRLILWSGKGDFLRRWPGGSDNISKLALSRHGRILASADTEIKLWNLQGRLLHTLKGHEKSLTDLQFNPVNNTLLSASKDGTIKLWNTEGRLLRTIKAHRKNRFVLHRDKHAAAWSGDGRRFACAGPDGKTHIRSMDGKLLQTITFPRLAARAIALDQTGERIAIVKNERLLKFSKDGRHTVAMADKGIVHLYTATGREIRSFNTDSSNPAIQKIAFANRDRELLITGAFGVLQKFQINGKKIGNVGKRYEQYAHAHWGNDGKTFVAAYERELHLYTDGTYRRTLADPTRTIWGFSPNRDSSLWVLWDRHSAGRLDIASLRLRRTGLRRRFPLTLVQSAPKEDLYAAAYRDGLIRLVGSDGFKELKHGSSISSLAFHPRGRFLASAGRDNRIRFWSLSGKQLGNVAGENPGPTSDLLFSPDGTLMAAVGKAPVITLRDSRGRRLRELKASDAVLSLAWNPAATRLAAVVGGKIQVWSRSGKLLHELGHEGDFTVGIAYAPSGKYLVSSNFRGGLHVWSKSGKLFRSFTTGTHGSPALHFFPAKSILAVGSTKGITLWNIVEGRLVGTVKVFHDDSVLVYTPKGRFDVSSEKAFTHFGFKVGDRISRAKALYTKRRLPGLFTRLLGQPGN